MILGLAHLEGGGVEQNDHAGYHWLRIAESNCSLVLEQSRCALDELRSRLPAEDIQELEQQIANKQQEEQTVKLKQARERFETEFSCRSKVGDLGQPFGAMTRSINPGALQGFKVLFSPST